MRPRNHFVSLAFVTFLTVLIVARPVRASFNASDNACNPPYGGTNWSSGQNGGTGFGPWSLVQSNSGQSSFFASTAANNGNGCASGGGIDGTCGASWGAFAGDGAIAVARRAFTGNPSSVSTNQSFTFSIDNGYINASGGAVGLALENSISNTVWEFKYTGGNNGGHYTINDNSGNNVNTGISYLESGLVVVFTLTSSTTYSASITPLGGSTTIITGTLKNPSGGRSIVQFRFYNNEPLTGNGCNFNAFLNSISVGCAPFTVSTPANQSVCLGNTASFSVATSGANVSSYQWQATYYGNIWNNVGNGTGGTTSNYTTAATNASDDGSQYRCLVANTCGTVVTSAVATLSVSTHFTITAQPTAQVGITGGSANFTIGTSATIFQWYKGPTGSGVALSNGGSISGATTATLTLSNLSTNDSGANFYVVVSGGCGGSPQTSTGAGLSVVTTDPFLKANGLNIRNGHGAGDIVPLHGANLGSWLLMESWMSPMDSSGVPDHYTAVTTLISRFGTNEEELLIHTYQANWIMASDLDNIRAMGMNLVRVPIMWTDLQRLDGTWRTDAFDRLDWVVSNAWQRGIYTLLDLHGVPGGQASSQDSGQQNLNAYWTSTADQNQTTLIWSNLAAHYVGNPAVAGYDLINEPYGAPTQLALWQAYNSLYQTVRTVDPDHIISMEGTWSGTGTNGQSLNWQWDVLPSPSTYGWSNVVYQMHAYAGSSSGVQGEVDKQTSDFISHQSWNVPDYIGEFQGYTTPSAWQYAITQFVTNNISWSTWAYKAGNGAGANWGIYYGTPAKPNLQTDSSNAIFSAWSGIQTTPGFTITSYLQQYLGGPLAVADSYSTTSGVTLAVNNTSGLLANDIDINRGQSGIQLQAALVNSPANGSLILNADGSFSYTPNNGFSGTDSFRYQVNDGYLTSVNIATVVITVNPGVPPPGSFQAWQVQYFGSTTNVLGAPNADPLGKGISNTNQFLLGLNPTNPSSTFQVISTSPHGADMVITWKTAGVRTNAVQANSDGNYDTNGFIDVSGPLIINVSGDTTTNYTDAGGATNVPSRFYRVRLVP